MSRKVRSFLKNALITLIDVVLWAIIDAAILLFLWQIVKHPDFWLEILTLFVGLLAIFLPVLKNKLFPEKIILPVIGCEEGFENGKRKLKCIAEPTEAQFVITHFELWRPVPLPSLSRLHFCSKACSTSLTVLPKSLNNDKQVLWINETLPEGLTLIVFRIRINNHLRRVEVPFSKSSIPF